MISKRAIQALTFVGVISLGHTANLAAQEPWNEVRKAFYEDCERFTGHANGICMRAAAQRMHNLSEESRALYKDCLEEGDPRSVCDQRREEYWQNKLAY
jgi:hypothetical protein